MESKPTEIIIDEEIREPKAKAEHGVPWEKMKFKVNAREFAQLMREYNIRTLEDVKTNTDTVVRLLQRLYAIDLGAVLTFAKQHEEGA